jgi:sugar/nucleoside kinase (ribokinase family)
MAATRRYDALIGTGGIGTGSFFALSGNHTLGREESRGGRFLDRRDYCKLHIICHYVQRLVGGDFKTMPVGKVGDDAPGHRLMAEMRSAGLDVSFTGIVPGEETLDCICLLYPDGSGGNLTVIDSASGRVTPDDVRKAAPWLKRFASRGIALAVPEVPLAARLELLDLAGQHDLLRAASFSSEEMETVRSDSLLSRVDLLAINLDEAASLAEANAGGDPEAIVRTIAPRLAEQFPHLKLSITAGAIGSWTIEGGAPHFIATPRVSVQSAAGAGDAHFSGILAGLAVGLELKDAQWVGILNGAMSVTSAHTIHPDIDRCTLRDFAVERGATPPAVVLDFLH